MSLGMRPNKRGSHKLKCCCKAMSHGTTCFPESPLITCLLEAELHPLCLQPRQRKLQERKDLLCICANYAPVSPAVWLLHKHSRADMLGRVSHKYFNRLNQRGRHETLFIWTLRYKIKNKNDKIHKKQTHQDL